MKRNMMRNALIIGILLLVPLGLTLRDQHLKAQGWNWSPADFVFAFVIPLTAAFVYELIALSVTKKSHRLLLAGAITAGVCVLWVELATGGVTRNLSQLF